MASIMSYMERKSEVEQGIEEQRLEMEKEKLKFEREKLAAEAEQRRQELDSVQKCPQRTIRQQLSHCSFWC